MSVRMSFVYFLERVMYGLFPAKKAMSALRDQWGREGDKRGFFVSSYFDLTRDASDVQVVDDSTWDDLEFPEIFSRMDATVSPIGSQFLFKQMRTYAADPDQLAGSYEMYDTLRSDTDLREAIQHKLLSLQMDESAYVADFIYGDLPRKKRFQALLPWWGLASLLVLLGVFFLSWPAWVWILMLAINVAIIMRMSSGLHRDAETIKLSLRMLGVADRLGEIQPGSCSLAPLRQLAKEKPDRVAARKAARWMSYLQRPGVEQVSIWLTFAFLLELVAYLHTMRQFARIRPQLASTFELVGSLDAAIAVAGCLERWPDHCQPEINEQQVLDVNQGYHPLLAEPVNNSVHLACRSALVTGSNMAGKTTFVKMLGVNMIFAQTLGFCLASRANVPRSPVMASIAGKHSVASGKSHYFAEVERIHAFLDSASRGDCTVFIIDELFSGTNTIERLAICRAVLERLGRNATVLVTTHDIELQDLLKNNYQLYHFQENPDVHGFFDFRLQSGAARQRNAIRLLERMEFPDQVIADAMTYVNQQDLI